MLKTAAPKQEESIPFDFEFDVSGNVYKFTHKGTDVKDALRRLASNLEQIQQDIVDALDEENIPKTPVKTTVSGIKPPKVKVVQEFKTKKAEEEETRASGIKFNQYDEKINDVIPRAKLVEPVD